MNISKKLRRLWKNDTSTNKHVFIEEILDIIDTHLDLFEKYENVAILSSLSSTKRLETKYYKKSTKILNRFGYGEYGESDELQVQPESWYYETPTGYFIYFHSYYDGETIETDCFLFYNDEKDVLNDLKSVIKVEPLKVGVYELKDTTMGPVFNKVLENGASKPILDDNLENTIVKDITTFFQNEEFYTTNNFPYKRGLLLYGSPGTGKTSCIKYIGTKVNVPTIIVTGDVSLDNTKKELLRTMCPNGCLIVIEDIESIQDYQTKRSEVLNFIDGLGTPRKCYFIATTNYLERVDFAFKNRPSRFDMVVEVGVPNDKTREELFYSYFGDNAKAWNMQKILRLTKGYTGALVKELFILYSLNKYTIEQAIEELDKRIIVANKVKYEDDEMYG